MKFLIFIIPSFVLAAGNSHGEGTPTDLIPSFVNVILLLGLLVWKLTPVIKNHFSSKAEEIDTVMRRAEIKAKEANDLMAVTSKKMAESDEEIKTLKSNAENQVNNYKAEYIRDVDHRIHKLNEDAKMKIEAEKKSLSDSVNELLVDKVINKSKNKISSNDNLSNNTKEKLLGDL